MYQYQVSFGEAVKRAFAKYCCFTGRASRSEYWWFALFVAIVGWCISIFGGVGFTGDSPSTGALIVAYVWDLFILLPSMGLCFRRLHDTGRSGWNTCWAFLPVIGTIILLVFLCQASQPGDNQYGPEPNMTDRQKG